MASSGEAAVLQVMFLEAFPETAGWYWGKFLFTSPGLVLNSLKKQSKAQIHQSRDKTYEEVPIYAVTEVVSKHSS